MDPPGARAAVREMLDDHKHEHSDDLAICFRHVHVAIRSLHDPVEDVASLSLRQDDVGVHILLREEVENIRDVCLAYSPDFYSKHTVSMCTANIA